MYQGLGQVQLKSGELVERCVVTGPEPGWTSKLVHLLGHKGAPWMEQAEATLTTGLDIESHFYLLHRDGNPFANIMTTELDGVGILGHVYTVPGDRRQGAASLLFEALAADFRSRRGRALFLGTGFDTPPYHLYARFGFEAVEPGSGYMQFHAGSADAFNDVYFAPGTTVVEPLGWRHWPASTALFTGPWPGVIRCAVQGLFGRSSSENPLLQLVIDSLARQKAGDPPCGQALVRPETTAVVGFACCGAHPLWPATTLLDVYCHPEYWSRAAELLDALSPARGQRQLAYVDAACPAKAAALVAAGFQPTATLAERIDQDVARTARLDVTIYEKAV